MRTKIPVVVLDPAGNAISGASVHIVVRSTGVDAVVYQADTGVSTLANPLLTDAAGRVSGWLERNAYDATVSATGLLTYIDQFESSPSEDGGADTAWLADQAVTTAKIADGAITSAKLTLGGLTIDTLPPLPAGGNNIGDVDVLTLPALPTGSNVIGTVGVNTLPSLPTGSNTIGNVGVLSLPAASPATDGIASFVGLKSVYVDNGSGFTALTVKRSAVFSVAASATDTVLVAGVASRQIMPLFIFFLGVSNASTIVFNSKGAGAGTAITPVLTPGANGGAVLWNPWGLWPTNLAEALTASTGAGGTTGIYVIYVELP